MKAKEFTAKDLGIKSAKAYYVYNWGNGDYNILKGNRKVFINFIF